MGLWSRIFRRDVKDEGPITTSHDLLKGFLLAYGAQSAAGIRVDPRTAMRCHAVFAAVRVLFETVGQLPINVIRVDSNGARKIVTDLPVSKIIATRGRPNTWMSSQDLREYGTRHAAASGNAFYYKNTVKGQLRELLPIHPSRVEVVQETDFSIRYRVSMKDGSTKEYGQKEIFHLRGPGDTGYTGDNVVVEHADAIGLMMAQEKFASLMFQNGVKNTGVLEIPGTMSDAAYERLKEAFYQAYAGLDNAHKPILLEGGTKFTPTSQTGEESQLLDSRKYQRSVIAALWRVPPHMVGDLEKATFSNIENLARQFVDYTLMPWLVRWENAIQLQLLTEEERQNHIVKINVNALLRGDAKTRAEFYAKLFNVASLNPNEIRDLEDMDPYDGGEEFYRPLNMENATAQAATDEETDSEEPSE
jgi:HK97 family phage portal protein